MIGEVRGEVFAATRRFLDHARGYFSQCVCGRLQSSRFLSSCYTWTPRVSDSSKPHLKVDLEDVEVAAISL